MVQWFQLCVTLLICFDLLQSTIPFGVSWLLSFEQTVSSLAINEVQIQRHLPKQAFLLLQLRLPNYHYQQWHCDILKMIFDLHFSKLILTKYSHWFQSFCFVSFLYFLHLLVQMFRNEKLGGGSVSLHILCYFGIISPSSPFQ